MRQSEWEKEKAIHILELVRSELYIDMPHFFNSFKYADVEGRRACSCMCYKWRVFLL